MDKVRLIFRSHSVSRTIVVLVFSLLMVSTFTGVVLVREEQDIRQRAQVVMSSQGVAKTAEIPGEIVVTFKDSVLEEVPVGEEVQGDSTTSGELLPGEVVRDDQVSEGSVGSQVGEVNSLSERELRIEARVRERLDRRLKRFEDSSDRRIEREEKRRLEAKELEQIATVVIPVKDGEEQMAIKEALSDLDVLTAEPNYEVEFDYVPNDAQYGEQYGLRMISAPRAWDIARGNGVKIAVIDSSFDKYHGDLSSNILGVRATGSTEGYHGTHVAGIAAAVTNNSRGIAGVCPSCKLLLASHKDSTGVSSDIVWATDNGAKVISMSFHSTGNKTMENAIKYAWSRGVVLVASAGNIEPGEPNDKQYPGYYPNVVSVASTDSGDYRSSFSKYGDWVDVAAPGSRIYSTLPNGSYGWASGTSMSTPMVAGVVGLMWSKYGLSSSNAAIVDRLEATADRIGGTGTYWKYGRVNAYRAVSGASVVAATPTPKPTKKPTAIPTKFPTVKPTTRLTVVPTKKPIVTPTPIKSEPTKVITQAVKPTAVLTNIAPTATLMPGPDLVVLRIVLTDGTGREKTTFKVNEFIYPKVIFGNTGTARALTPTGRTDSMIYANKPSPMAFYIPSDVGIRINNGEFNAGYKKEYGSSSAGPNGGEYRAAKSWAMSTPGSYTARAIINYDKKAQEVRYVNNQSSVKYTVVR